MCCFASLCNPLTVSSCWKLLRWTLLPFRKHLLFDIWNKYNAEEFISSPPYAQLLFSCTIDGLTSASMAALSWGIKNNWPVLFFCCSSEAQGAGSWRRSIAGHRCLFGSISKVTLSPRNHTFWSCCWTAQEVWDASWCQWWGRLVEMGWCWASCVSRFHACTWMLHHVMQLILCRIHFPLMYGLQFSVDSNNVWFFFWQVWCHEGRSEGMEEAYHQKKEPKAMEKWSPCTGVFIIWIL